MHVRLHSLVLIGLDGQVVDVEVDVASGFPQFLLVGLADTVVQEARERVRSALKNSGYRFPDGRVTVSLSPSHVRKEGAWFDLPIAVGILLASQQIHDPSGAVEKTLWCGELGLDGSVQRTGKELAQVMSVSGYRFILAKNSLSSLAGVEVECCGMKSLKEVGDLVDTGTVSWEKSVMHLTGERFLPKISKLQGLEAVERALQVALVGRHHVLLYGPPGTGKSALSHLAEHWLPNLEIQQALEVGRVWSTSGIDPGPLLVTQAPPFRGPHHTASSPSMVGGGNPLKAGEISLSHHGILFLDELPEFRREVLEALREPLQEKVITINRAQGQATFPADTQLIATLNPCSCGFLGDDERPCTCSAAGLERYRRKLSGPLLDRFAICVRVDRVEAEEVLKGSLAEYTVSEVLAVRQKIKQARLVPRSGNLAADTKQVLTQAAHRFSLSPRAICSTQAVAQSVAALGGRSQVEPADMAEALQYRWRGWVETS